MHQHSFVRLKLLTTLIILQDFTLQRKHVHLLWVSDGARRDHQGCSHALRPFVESAALLKGGVGVAWIEPLCALLLFVN